MRFSFLIFLVFLTACSVSTPEPTRDSTPPPLTLTPTSFAALEGWQEDDLSEIAPALVKSCGRILKRAADKPMGSLKQAGTAGDWQPLCREFMAIDDRQLRTFFEARFTPYRLAAGANTSPCINVPMIW